MGIFKVILKLKKFVVSKINMRVVLVSNMRVRKKKVSENVKNRLVYPIES